ncbi:hypothetical protein MmTuc01_1703 [Methanosarcina mazei Tuc01]|nr:hypothetical protein MmTuc01_1703 [Methanosarcina mazei Tuc01]
MCILYYHFGLFKLYSFLIFVSLFVLFSSYLLFPFFSSLSLLFLF